MTDQGPALILVRQNDGRLDPLEPDRVSRALFAATESLGTPDAFLARELADAITPALAADMQSLVTIQELADSVAKFVRELGHPAIARVYREQARLPDKHDNASNKPPHLWQVVDPNAPARQVHRQLAEPPLREMALCDVYPRDIVSMIRDGLMQLRGLEHPFELAASLLGDGLRAETARLGIASAVTSAARHTGEVVVLDGPEHALAALDGEPRELAAEFFDEWRLGLEATGLAGSIHLNHAAAPAWASDPQTGPLFGGLSRPANPERRGEIAIAIVEQANEIASISWHVSRADVEAEHSPLLRRVIESVRNSQAVEFVLDRARQPVSLGPGLTRNDPAVLLFVGVHLARLAEQISPRTPERFLEKLGSLARLARSAGHAKFDFLRRHGKPELKRGFKLERARLVVTPIGLEEATRMAVDRPACDLGPGTEFARAAVAQLAAALTREPPRNMEAILDSLPAHLGFGFTKGTPNRRDIAGLTVWDGAAPLRQQVQASGELHATANAGTAAILVSAAMPSVDELVQLLRLAAQRDVRRVRFVPRAGDEPD